MNKLEIYNYLKKLTFGTKLQNTKLFTIWPN